MKQPPPAGPRLRLPGNSWWWLASSALLLAVTLGLGFMAKLYGSPGLDLAMDQSLIPARSPGLTELFLAVHFVFSPLGNIIILALICLALATVGRRLLTALAFGSLVSVGWLSSEIGKVAVGRLRPPAAATQALIQEVGNDSFPSGHTAFAAALAWGAILVLARSPAQRTAAGIGGAMLVAVVAFSRLYLGVHYPSDVLGAVLISTAGVLCWLPLWNRLLEPMLSGTPLIRSMTKRDAGEGDQRGPG